MNKILQGVLINMGKVAASTVPGGNVVVSGIEALAAARKTADKGDDVEAGLQMLVGGIQVSEGLGGHFAEEPGFQMGLYQVKAGVTQMVASVKAHQAAEKATARPTP
jgi:hypothetical protein